MEDYIDYINNSDLGYVKTEFIDGNYLGCQNNDSDALASHCAAYKVLVTQMYTPLIEGIKNSNISRYVF